MSKDPKIRLDWRNPYPHPGTWKQFCIREDNEELTLEERRQKFLKEESLYYKFRSPIPYNSWLGGGGAGGNSFTGNASDGPIAGATVTCNLGTVVTDSLGNFTYPDTPAGEITVTGGTDAITGVAFTGELKGFPEYKTVSPLTTLAYHLKEEDTSLDVDGAIDLLFVSSSTIFGIELAPEDKDVMLNKDYVAESVSRDNQKAVAAQSIATYLESVTEMVGSAVKGADRDNFTSDNAKVQGYKSIARQLRDTRGAKTAINPETLFDKVTLPDGGTFKRAESIEIEARRTIKTQLDNVKTQLDSLSRNQSFTANYLTTQIQAINRGVKEQYVAETEKLVRREVASFDNMNVLIAKSTGSIAQLEKGKANETDAARSKRPPSERFVLGSSVTVTQETKNRKTGELETSTLTFEEPLGILFVIGSEIERGQVILATEFGDAPVPFSDFENYNKEVPIKLQTEIRDESGKTNIVEVILSNPGQRVISSQTTEKKNYLPVAAGGYTMQFAGPSLEGKILWENAIEQPFTASIAANQESISVNLTRRGFLGGGTTNRHDLEYNTETNRYEYSTTTNPPEGTKTLTAHIANFTHEAEWTVPKGIKLENFRFQINNFDTDHIDASDNAVYTWKLDDGRNSETLEKSEKGKQNLEYPKYVQGLIGTFALPIGGEVGQLKQLTLTPMESKPPSPNGPFKLNVRGSFEPVAENLRFTNNVCQFTATIERVPYTVTITRVIRG